MFSKRFDSSLVTHALAVFAIMLLIFILLFVLAFFIIGGSLRTDAPRTQAEMALRSAEDWVAVQPDNVEAVTALGAAQVDAGQNRRAISSLRDALEREKTHYQAWYHLGRAYRGLGEDDNAIQAFEAAGEYAIEAKEARLKELELKGIEQPLVIPDEGALGLLGAGQIYRERGDHDKALEKVGIVVEDNPIDAGAIILMAQIYEERGDKDNARKYYTQAGRMLPDDEEIREALERLN